MSEVPHQPQWPQIVALIAFVLFGTVIGFNCAGGLASLDYGLDARAVLGAFVGALLGLILFGAVAAASRRNRDR